MMGRSSGVRRWLVVGVLLAALVVAVSSSSAATSGSSVAPSATAASGKQVVRIFGFGVYTDPALGALFGTATFAVNEPKLVAKYVDASPTSKVTLEYTMCNTKGTPAGAVACGKEASSPTACGGHPCDVAMDTTDPEDNLDVPLIGKAGIPIVGATTSTPQAAFTPDDFGIGASLEATQSALGYLIKRLGAHKVGIMSVERPDVQAYDNAMSGAVAGNGMTISGVSVLSSTTVAPNAAIDTVLSGGADGLLDTAVGNVGAQLQYAEQTYPGVKIALPVFMIAKPLFDGLPDSVTNGVGVTADIEPVTATSVPGIKQFIAEGGLTVTSPGYRGGDFATAVWLATRFIANVANTISGPITKTSMLHALKTAKNIDMYGLVPPWNASQRGKNGAAPNTPYADVVDETLHNVEEDTNSTGQYAINPGVFVNDESGKVAYVDPGFKAP